MKSIKTALLWVLTAFLLWGIFYYSGEVKDGVLQGLSVCYTTLIPSIFPFLVLTGFLQNCPLTPSLNKIFRPLSFLYGLPDHMGGTVFLSLIGGYPAGAVLAANAVKHNEITARDGERMICGTIAAGPSFLVLGVGSAMCGSLQLGWYLLAAHFTASLLCGILFRRKRSKKEVFSFSPVYRSAVDGFTLSVSDACTKMLVICGFAVLASVLTAIFTASGIFSAISDLVCCILPVPANAAQGILTGIMEVTSGCIYLSSADGGSFLLLAMLTSLCSLSVFAQISSILTSAGISCKAFVSSRIPHALISVFVAWILYKIAPPVLQTGTKPDIIPWNASPLVSVFLLMMFLYVIYPQKILKKRENLL